MAKRSADGLFKRGAIWWGWRRLFPGAPLKRASTKCRDRQAARLVKAEWERSAADPIHYASNKTTLGEAIAMFLADSKNAGLAVPTLEMYAQKCRHIARVLDQDRPLRSVVATTWDGYAKTREEEGAHPHTVKKELIRGFGVLKAAKRRGLYPHDLSTVMPRYSARYEPRKRALTMDELQRLGRELRADRLAHVAFVVATGCRLKESYRARAGHMLPEGFVYLDGTKTKRAKRTIPIAPPLRPFLEFAIRNAPGSAVTCLRETAIVGPTENEADGAMPQHARAIDGVSKSPLFSRWTNSRRDILEACKRAGIAPCTWNDLRRTNATLLAEAGVGSDLGAKLLGHVDGRMWEQVYAQPKPRALQRSLDAAFDGTDSTQPDALAPRSPEEIAKARGRKPGLRSRRSQVRILPGAPENLSNSAVSAEQAPDEASTGTPDAPGLQRTNSTVDDRDGALDKWDLAAAYLRVTRRAS